MNSALENERILQLEVTDGNDGDGSWRSRRSDGDGVDSDDGDGNDKKETKIVAINAGDKNEGDDEIERNCNLEPNYFDRDRDDGEKRMKTIK